MEKDLIINLYELALPSSISERERKIVMLAKSDIDRKKYLVAIVNKLQVSLQKESMANGLTPAVSEFYKQLGTLLDKIAPLGTNRGSILLTQGYLD
ncbi:bacteriocin immunity protein [Lactococcus nasutitermitis]|uniref:Bacteriocin immunity protein n=1 Tax=Lactococcus nasutitermitis TaxID=1652957 RepID=A0ABV9JE41_9LACT|nr:bacteriocin immunity protein [Lactococcus nasutitermitis]